MPRMNTLHAYNYQIYVVDREGDILEKLGELDNFNAAHAAFVALLTERTSSTIQLRNGGRIVKTAETGLYDYKTKTVALLKGPY